MNLLDTLVKTRARRLLFSVLMPPAAGVFMLILIDSVGAGPFFLQLEVVLGLIMFSYILMGLQSLLAGLLMEYVVLEFAVKRYQMVIAGVLLGALAGATLAWMTPEFIAVGAGVGLMVGWVYRRCI